MQARTTFFSLAAAALIGAGTAATLAPQAIMAEDIDIYTGSSGAGTAHVLVVLDNTANWARQSQGWPGGLQQGQSEVRALQASIAGLSDKISVGLFEFDTAGSGGEDGGYVRFHMRPMTAANKTTLSNILVNQIFPSVNDPIEKRNANVPYGHLFNDVYSYLSGGRVLYPAALPTGLVDNAGYSTRYTNFSSPLSGGGADCGNTFIIFISNPNSNGPTADVPENGSTLQSLGGDPTQMRVPAFQTIWKTTGSSLGFTNACYASTPTDATCAADFSTTCASYESCGCTSPAVTTVALPTCSSGLRYNVVGVQNTTITDSDDNPGVTTLDQLTGGSTGCVNSRPSGSLTCPAPSTVVQNNTPSTGFTTTKTTSWANCKVPSTENGSSCGGSKKDYPIHGDKTVRTVVTHVNTTRTTLGNTFACYTSPGACSTGDFATACGTYNGGCACDTAVSTSGGVCPSPNERYEVQGRKQQAVVTKTGTYIAPGTANNLDEWALFLRTKGVPLADGSRVNVATYTIDVFHDQQSADHTSLMLNTADKGGGVYYAATNEESIKKALDDIFSEILAVNSTFASASLPVSATNRTQNENAVFIGMFRPDKKPRWYGNLKRYQLISPSVGEVDLGDADAKVALNTQTGFLKDCARSYWTTNSGTYWSNVTSQPPAKGSCADPDIMNGISPYSDTPDGPLVEKGAAAEVLRKGNSPPGTDTTPTFAVNRRLLTLSGGSPATATAANTGLSSDLFDFTSGLDLADENADGVTTTTRPSIHGDVVHSRPLAVSYLNGDLTVFYGANDGYYHAVNANNGKERWAFIPPEVNATALQRLQINGPNVKFPTLVDATAQRKNYFFDGSTGMYRNAGSSDTIWIFPAMRRGGRMIYAFDVSSSTANPGFKWRVGCPYLDSDSGCTSGMSSIGQTWSTPLAAFIAGYNSGTTPVVIVGGGYDACEDDNSPTPSCGSAKGRAVYVLDANLGTVLATFPTTRGVAADLALADVNFDGKVDYAYAADLGGNIYRINFATFTDPAATDPVTPLGPADWSITRIAYTNGGGRKFEFAPALVPTGYGKVYVAIGSGDREHPLTLDYPYQNVTNRYYVYLDDLTSSSAVSLDDTSVMLDYTSANSCTSEQVLPGSAHRGWFMSLNANGQGEQVVTSSVVLGRNVRFSTNRPLPVSANACIVPLGEARGYSVSLFNAAGGVNATNGCNGSRSTVFAGGGLPPSPVIATVPVGGEVRTVCIGCDDALKPKEYDLDIPAVRKRVYWKKSGDAN